MFTNSRIIINLGLLKDRTLPYTEQAQRLAKKISAMPWLYVTVFVVITAIGWLVSVITLPFKRD